jgi:hypothetical protein
MVMIPIGQLRTWTGEGALRDLQKGAFGFGEHWPPDRLVLVAWHAELLREQPQDAP